MAKQLLYLLLVSFYVLPEFFLPLFAILFRACCISAALMSVPEASVHEYQEFVLGHDNIRPAGQLGTMQTKPKSIRMQKASHDQLWPGILAFYASHHSRSRSAVDYVRHTW
ncbi:MAG: hypothetical protein Q8K52_01065 [Thiobacillus sp.]|nr:hypothetical protein [Thiobacillus sp.]